MKSLILLILAFLPAQLIAKEMSGCRATLPDFRLDHEPAAPTEVLSIAERFLDSFKKQNLNFPTFIPLRIAYSGGTKGGHLNMEGFLRLDDAPGMDRLDIDVPKGSLAYFCLNFRDLMKPEESHLTVVFLQGPLDHKGHSEASIERCLSVKLTHLFSLKLTHPFQPVDT